MIRERVYVRWLPAACFQITRECPQYRDGHGWNRCAASGVPVTLPACGWFIRHHATGIFSLVWIPIKNVAML